MKMWTAQALRRTSGGRRWGAVAAALAFGWSGGTGAWAGDAHRPASLATHARPAVGKAARTTSFTATSTMAAFDRIYIPALFLSGNAGKGPDAAARATASMQRLLAVWPEQQHALRAVAPSQAAWTRAVDRVGERLAEARQASETGAWPQVHEILEHVREDLSESRRKLAMSYELDDYTAYHARMEALAGVREVNRVDMLRNHAQAQRQWARIAAGPVDPEAFGLTATQQERLREAQGAETRALEALGQVLRHGADAEVREAAKALKPPFVKAYIAFGRD